MRVADRLERAIEERADVERGDRARRASSRRADRLRRTAFWLAVTGVSLYLVAPSVLEVAGSWKDLDQFGAVVVRGDGGAPGGVADQPVGAAAACDPRAAWRPVIASQLAGNALAKVAPGGGAMGAALQYKMLVQAGIGRGRAVGRPDRGQRARVRGRAGAAGAGGPAIVRGVVPRSLTEATLAGLGVFAVLFALAALLLARDGALAWVGRTVQRARNRLRRGSPPLTQLPQRLLRERDRILGTLGPRWKRALAATVGRWAFDYATLLAALAAVGSTPRWSLVLLAFCAAQLLAQIPVTPGGLGSWRRA